MDEKNIDQKNAPLDAVPPKKKRPKKDPLPLRFFIIFCRFFLYFDEYIRARSRETVGFYIEFFTGLPVFFRYLFKKYKKKRKAQKRNKERLRAEKAALAPQLRQQKEEEKRLRAEKRREKAEARRARLTVERRMGRLRMGALAAASVLVLECSVFLGIGALYLYKSFDSRGNGIALSLVIDKNTMFSTSVPADFSSAGVAVEPCFDLAFLSRNLGFFAFGDDKNMMYTLGSGQKLKVSNGSNTVYIDGLPVSLGSAVLFDGGRIYASTELLLKYFEGIEVNFDKKKNKLTLLCTGNEGGEISLRPGAIKEAGHPVI